MSTSLQDIIGQLQRSGLLADPSTSADSGLFGKLAAPYGGTANLGLNVLANSGPSLMPKSFGQIVGQSALQAQQVSQQTQMNALQRQLMAMQIAQGAVGLGTTMQRLNAADEAFPSGGQTSGPANLDQNGPPSGTISAPPLPQGSGPQTSAQPPPQGSALPSMSPQQINALARFTALGPNANALDVADKAQQMRIKQLQAQIQPKLAAYDAIAHSDDPIRDIKGDPQLEATWSQLANAHHIDAVKGFTPDTVRTVFSLAGNQIRAANGLPPQEVVQPVRQDGISQYDAVTGKLIGTEPTDKYVLPGGKVVELSKKEGVARGLTPYSPFSITAAEMEGPVGALDAALTSAGVNIPGGRSGQQRVATLKNLIAANPGMAPQEIANQVRTGQLDFNGAKRSTGQLATLAAAADVQSRKIEKDLASLGPIVQKLPGGPSTVVGWMTNLQKNWTWNGDKNSTEAVGYLKELAGEYAKLVSGSPGMSAPAEGEMKSALGLMQNALTKDGYAGMSDFLKTTSANRRSSVREGLQDAARSGTSVGQSPQVPQTNAKGWALHVDKNGNRAYVSPNGKDYELVK